MDTRLIPWVGLLIALLVWIPTWSHADEEDRRGRTPTPHTSPGGSLLDSLSFTARKAPIHIRSRALEFLYNEKRIKYQGDVIVTQADVTLKSDSLTVRYEELPTERSSSPNAKSASPRQQLQEIVAEGHVEITANNRRATGDKMVFHEVKRTVVLSGNAVLWDGANQVTGERVTVHLDEQRTVVEGNPEMILVQQHVDGEKVSSQ